ncbi:MAG: sulfur carrier protein ThiS [Actinobacteria bacterium]|nr:sulfur carrier protein ThiS [Actinomycetota bacterium]MCA1719859.1 sulfur carrier protein ThiS [Actinomycetota bacterium]
MEVTVNGHPAELAAGSTVADLVAARAEQHRRVAVARNGDVVPRSAWGATVLVPGDAVEVLVATAGG